MSSERTIWVSPTYIPTTQKLQYCIVHTYLSLDQQWNSILSSCLVPTYPVQSTCVLKGWLYSLLLYDFTEPLLPAFDARKSWPKLSDPYCKPQSGPPPGLCLILIHILPAPSRNWKKFMSAQQIFRAPLRHTHKAASLLKLTWGYLFWLRPVKINKSTEELSLVKWWDFRDRGKQQLPKPLWTLSAEWELC